MIAVANAVLRFFDGYHTVAILGMLDHGIVRQACKYNVPWRLASIKRCLLEVVETQCAYQPWSMLLAQTNNIMTCTYIYTHPYHRFAHQAIAK